MDVLLEALASWITGGIGEKKTMFELQSWNFCKNATLHPDERFLSK